MCQLSGEYLAQLSWCQIALWCRSGLGVALGAVEYKPAVQLEQPELKEVWLEGITLEGRTAVVYSPYGIGCGIDGHVCVGCRGLVSKDAKKLAGNIILYALSY